MKTKETLTKGDIISILLINKTCIPPTLARTRNNKNKLVMHVKENQAPKNSLPTKAISNPLASS